MWRSDMQTSSSNEQKQGLRYSINIRFHSFYEPNELKWIGRHWKPKTESMKVTRGP